MEEEKQELTAQQKEEKLLAELKEYRIRCRAVETKGTRFTVPREGKAGVETILYRPAAPTAEKLPVVFNMHGGGWIGGDAILMESFCRLLADALPAVVVNVNYTKADVQPYPYFTEEVRDAVLYFAAHAEEYGIDPTKAVVGGHSAGAHIAAGAAILLRDAGFALAGQMLVYPAVDFSSKKDKEPDFYVRLVFRDGGIDQPAASPVSASNEALQGLAPAMFVVCGRDSLRPQGLAYADRLQRLGIEVAVKEYPDALHGFLEVCRPEYPEDERQSPAQAEMARDCEQWLIRCMRNLFDHGAFVE